MCIFHLREDHDGDTFPKMNRYKQMNASKELIVESLKSEEDYATSDFGRFYLEYEIGSERGDNYFTTLDGVKMIVTTRSQKNKSLVGLVLI